LSGRGLCDELITRPEESYRLWCVVVYDLETSRIGAPYIYDISNLRVNICIMCTVFVCLESCAASSDSLSPTLRDSASILLDILSFKYETRTVGLSRKRSSTSS